MMSYRLKSGETASDVAWRLLGDRRLTNELQIVNGVAYVRGEKPGPPARWALDPNPVRHSRQEQ